MAAPVLELDTLVERATVVIDGQAYELLNSGELSIFELHKFSNISTEFSGLTAKSADAEVTAEQAAAVTSALDRMVRIILKAPDDVLARLKDAHKFKIVAAFNGLTLKSVPAAVVSEPAGGETQVPPTGEKS